MPYPSDLRYSKDHEWVRLSGDLADVGITDYAQEQLGDVVFVDVPPVGTVVTAGSPFGTIESVKAVSELFAPVGGEVVEVNARLKDHPDEVNSKPHDTWIVRIRVSDAGAADALLTSAQYEGLLS